MDVWIISPSHQPDLSRLTTRITCPALKDKQRLVEGVVAGKSYNARTRSSTAGGEMGGVVLEKLPVAGEPRIAAIYYLLDLTGIGVN
jgi:hypothetical protein